MSANFPNYASITNLALIEEMYARYANDPNSVDSSWKYFFQGMDFASQKLPSAQEPSDARLFYLIEAYRRWGHLGVKCNPIDVNEKESIPALEIETYGFTSEDLDRNFPSMGFSENPEAPLSEILSALKDTYSGRIGFEFKDLGFSELELWVQKRIEPCLKIELSMEEKKQLLQTLNHSEILESFLHTKYVGQKRFSLEGEETLIPVLKAIVEQAATAYDMAEMIFCMAHRGRLNVLTNIFNKSYSVVFHEFQENYVPGTYEGSGDVKYHKGFSADITTASNKKIHLHLAANPSHLESVTPVALGQTRAKQVLKYHGETDKIGSIIMHGEAALAGQGVVYESLQMGKIPGFSTGGSIHIVINNQIGFTTLPEEGRSTRYCTDIAKTFGSPVFHVNAEDPESCVYVAKLALDIRQKFQCDVFIDLQGYRKYGHNEGDEPAFTQPLQYKLIRSKKSIREIYRDHLVSQGFLEKEMAERLEGEFRSSLQEALERTKEYAEKPPKPEETLGQVWNEFAQATDIDVLQQFATAYDAEKLVEITKQFTKIPPDFHLHKKLQKAMQDRLKMVQDDPSKPSLDWAMGETLAFGSLLWEGMHVRLAGQDSRRGTFNHRHAMWVDTENGKKYFPLQHLREGQGRFDVLNDILSEFATMAYEYGYSLSYPNGLILWEAQYGDFCNAAQVTIDQYITTSEQKWSRYSSLVLLLPHGYEGAGAEHSSARMERFLQLCGHDNIQVVNPSTPAQFFHLLRKQALRPLKKPLIVFTPKSLLRNPLCQSSLNDFSKGTFEEVIDDSKNLKNVRKLLLCSGKMYYDLYHAREESKIEDVALVRIEQFYPLHVDKLRAILEKYTKVPSIYWVQEEPCNMGAWDFMRPYLHDLLLSQNRDVEYIGRKRAASPAVGSSLLHKKTQKEIIETALG